MALAGSLAGCSATSPPVRRQAAKPAFSINGGTACIPTPASPATKDPNAWFVQARKEWKLGEETDAADVGLCWEKAALDLNSIGSIQAPGINGFATAARELQRLTLLPDSMETAAQMAEGQNLIRRLNAFLAQRADTGSRQALQRQRRHHRVSSCPFRLNQIIKCRQPEISDRRRRS